MPSANIFVSDLNIADKIKKSSQDFREFLAKNLSCGDRTLAANEISLRLIQFENIGAIAPVEIEITAHAYPKRVTLQDEICRETTHFWKSHGVNDTHVWLLLCELGHSWDEKSAPS